MKEIKLTKIERKELERISRAQAVSVAQSRRARLILLLAQGAKWVSIREKLGCDTRFISRWGGRFIAERLAGLSAAMRDGQVTRSTSDWRPRFLPGRLRESPPMDRLTGPVVSLPVNWVEYRT